MKDPTAFKLLGESCGLSVKDTARQLKIPFGTAVKYAEGSRPAPPELLRQLEDIFCKVEKVAQAYRWHPERIQSTALAPILHRAAHRRVYEINATDPKRPARLKK